MVLDRGWPHVHRRACTEQDAEELLIDFDELDHSARAPLSRRNPRRAYDERGQEIGPMTLQDAMSSGVNALRVICGCEHQAEVPISIGRGPSKSLLPDASMTLRCAEYG